jgi:serine/threonine protein kinase
MEGLYRMHKLKPRPDNPNFLYGVHSDIKPDNILIVEGMFKLADFGFTKFIQTNGCATADIDQTSDGGTHVYGT